ncbi:MAG: DNA primase [Patescibacteria group bacterium]
MSDTVEQIKSRLDIVDVVSGYVKVQKAGANYKARCPFHNEKTPSFHLSPERQSWHCFGCNKGGDMFSFVQEIEGIDFVEALRILAGKAGVQMQQRRPEDEKITSQRQALLAVAELSAKFFEKQLWNSNAGAKALAYLRERGMTDDTIRAWHLGWAPNDWRALTGFLTEQNHQPASIVGAGMAVQKKPTTYNLQATSSIYDRFRSRIMFPICDANGQVIGFTGRVFGAEVAVDGEPLAKYVNTPQTAIYDKGRVLYGLDKAKGEMRSKDACLLVEGNVDAVMSWQAGARHAVATSGTALTPHQLRMLGRYSANLDFCFDTDEAGKTATRRGIGLALAQSFNVRILTIQDRECKDPADYVQKYGVRWNEVVASSKPALQFYYDEAVASFNPASVQAKKFVIASLGPLIRRLTSRVEQGHWVGQLATLLRADQRAVEADIATVKDDIAGYDRQADEETTNDKQQTTSPEPLDTTSQELLALMVRQPSLAAQLTEYADQLDARVAAVVVDPAMLEKTYDGEHRHLIDVAVIRANELWQEYTPEQLEVHMATLVNRIRERRVRVLRAGVELEIRQADAAKDAPRLQELVAKFQDYTTQLNQLQNIQSPINPS